MNSMFEFFSKIIFSLQIKVCKAFSLFSLPFHIFLNRYQSFFLTYKSNFSPGLVKKERKENFGGFFLQFLVFGGFSSISQLFFDQF